MKSWSTTLWESFLLFCLVAEPFILFAGVMVILTERRSRREASFVPIDATVERVWVEPHGGGRGSPRYYSSRVSFRYRIGGQMYQSVASARGTAKTQQGAEAVAKSTYPVGKKISAFYDPANPRDAVLERTTPQKDFWTVFLCCPGVPALLLLPGSILAVRHIIDTRRRRASPPAIS